MITDTESYKGRKFTCDKCGYVVSSDAMSDFDVDDFYYCPYCGYSTAIPFEQKEVINWILVD